VVHRPEAGYIMILPEYFWCDPPGVGYSILDVVEVM
jgi:hypothetical protein